MKTKVSCETKFIADEPAWMNVPTPVGSYSILESLSPERVPGKNNPRTASVRKGNAY